MHLAGYLNQSACINQRADKSACRRLDTFLKFSSSTEKSVNMSFKVEVYLLFQRRVKELKKKGIHFVGSGVSGGEDGARYGPSLMPGGAPEAWPHIKDIFQGCAAKIGTEPCCDWVSRALSCD